MSTLCSGYSLSRSSVASFISMRSFLRAAAGLLSRRTSDGSFLPVIDGLRFVAISWVFLFHSAGFVGKRVYAVDGPLWGMWNEGFFLSNAVVRFCSVGFFGVQLFFTISGFVLALPFARARLTPDNSRSPRLRDYLIRRVTRLEPPYVINILTCALWAVLAKDAPIREVIASALASLAYVHEFLLPGTGTLNGVAWSLEIEVRFYLLAPLLALVFLVTSSSARRSLLVAGIVGSCVSQSLVPTHLCYGHSVVNHGHYFLLGFLLADLYVVDWPTRPLTRAWDAAGFAGWLGLVITLMVAVNAKTPIHGPGIHAVTCILMFFAYAGSLRGMLLHGLFTRPPIYLVGGMCYTIYLWHCPIIGALGRVLGYRLSSGSLAVDCLGYAITFALLGLPPMTILFVLLERPFMDKAWPLKAWATLRAIHGRKDRSTALS